MSYQQMVTNEVGEPLGIETLYDDESTYWDDREHDYPYADYDYDDEPDTTQDGFPYETDLGDEWQ